MPFLIRASRTHAQTHTHSLTHSLTLTHVRHRLYACPALSFPCPPTPPTPPPRLSCPALPAQISAGRTDAGVHVRSMPCHFDLPLSRTLEGPVLQVLGTSSSRRTIAKGARFRIRNLASEALAPPHLRALNPPHPTQDPSVDRTSTSCHTTHILPAQRTCVCVCVCVCVCTPVCPLTLNPKP
jgi:hypothetical protein